uniref:Uncharacterized protein n=1 Tax=Ditylenchus dipsaci TaxID=166011 RepID=A0A915CYL8_9BILA
MEKRLVIPGTKHFDKHKKGIEKILHTDTVGQMDERTNKIIRELSENPIPDWFYAKGIVEAGMPFYYSILLMRRQNYFWFDPLNPSPIIVGLSVTSAPHLDKKNPLEIGESEHAYQTASVSSSPSWTISIQLFTVYCFI